VHLWKFWTCNVCAPCMTNLSHGSAWHLCFVYTGKQSGFTDRLVLGIRFVNTITGFWAGIVVWTRMVKILCVWWFDDLMNLISWVNAARWGRQYQGWNHFNLNLNLNLILR
jgi:hypothetical protein